MYKEFVILGRDAWNVTLVGNCMHATVISGSRCWADGFGTCSRSRQRVHGVFISM